MSKKTYDEDELKRLMSAAAEYFDDKMARVLEAVTAMQEKIDRLPKVEEDIKELKSDIKTVKAAVTATNHDVRTLDRRVTRLETKLA